MNQAEKVCHRQASITTKKVFMTLVPAAQSCCLVVNVMNWNQRYKSFFPYDYVRVSLPAVFLLPR